ncbi:MAG TPA: phosphate uptake regulator PhoU [Candidatus Nanoarchaeia archaeon]|nr:phosphate uptake regulator PhoU [Candidatus Nanoarchaeia archaeon]
MESYRKLIKFGNSSYVVSLPNDWIKRNKLEKGDSLFISEGLNNGLVLNPRALKEKEAKKEITINIKEKDTQRIKREIISAYLNNCDILRVQGGNNSPVKEVREVIKNLMALEIIDENSKEIVAKDFMDLKEVTFEEIIRKIDTITRSMMADIKNIDKEDLSENINERDEQVNRLVYLVIRTLRFTLDNPGNANRNNLLSMAGMLNVWDVTLNIEKIADDLKRAARQFSNIRPKTKVMQDLKWVFSDIERCYLETMKAYYGGNVEKAFTLSLLKRKLSDKCNGLHSKYWREQYVPIVLENFKNMISSIHNIGRRTYS